MADTTGELLSLAADTSDSPRARALRRLARRKAALVGLCLIALFTALALLAPLIAPYDPAAQSWATVRKPPSLAHWLGTDEVGRDVLSRLIWGARASLLAGLIPVTMAVVVSIPLGLVSGYAGGWIDDLIMRLTDAMLAIPFLIVAIALAAFLGPSLTNAMIAIGIAALPVFVRLARNTVLTVKAEEYVEAARALGGSPFRIGVRAILPNMLPPLVIQSSLTVAAAIIAESSLSFLGLGQQPPAPSWGSMLNTAKNYVENAPWMAVWPGLSIFLLVLSFNLLGDGLRDVFDPKLG